MRKKKEARPGLIGVGLPTQNGYIPVTYSVEGMPTVIFVGGLHVSDVSASKDNFEPADEHLAKNALETVTEIVDCWNEYKTSVIQDHLYQKSDSAAAKTKD